MLIMILKFICLVVSILFGTSITSKTAAWVGGQDAGGIHVMHYTAFAIATAGFITLQWLL